MEADHFRLQFLHCFAHRLIKRRAIRGVYGSGRVEPQFFKIGRKPLLPSSLSRSIGGELLVAEEVHVHGCRHPLTDDIDLLARLLGGQHRAWERTQRAGLGRRDH